MLYSQLFGKTKLTAPHDADSVNAKYLTQGGFIEKVAAGIYNFLPLGQRVLEKVKRIIREEMDGIGSQEILMPALHPLELWQTTGRDKTANDILYRTKGAGDKNFVIAASHEETVTPLAKKFIQSYKDLPCAVYQIQTKFRDEPRAKSGLLRGREFGMKDMYSFHVDSKDLDIYYERVKQAYMNVYRRCGLEAYIVEASGGIFSDKLSHEFSVITPAGEDTIIVCGKCSTAQNLEIAEGKIQSKEELEEQECPLKTVGVHRGHSIEESAAAHGTSPSKVLKSVVYAIDGGGFIGVAIRGDLQVNETKLANYLKSSVCVATSEELDKIGLVKGFISPVMKKSEQRLPFIADHSIRNIKNFVTGANKKDTDLVNVNLGRDFTIDDFTDLVVVQSGFTCPRCNGPLEELKAIEAGNIFKLGTKYSKDFDLYFTDESGERKHVIMGCYGIGTTRLVGTIVESSNDEKGIIWPKTVAPYHVHLITLGKEADIKKSSVKLYDEMTRACIEVLYDDRDETAGRKLNDADLIGLPLRIVISGRTLEKNSAEWKLRHEKDVKLVHLDKIVNEIKNWIAS